MSHNQAVAVAVHDMLVPCTGTLELHQDASVPYQNTSVPSHYLSHTHTLEQTSKANRGH